MGFLVIEDFLQDLKESVRVEAQEFLQETLIGAKPNNVHSVKSPTFLAETALGELFAFEKKFDYPKYLIANVGGAVLDFKFQSASLFEQLLLVVILQLCTVRVRQFEDRGSVVLKINSQ